MVGKRCGRERPFGFGLGPETGGRCFHILCVVTIAPRSAVMPMSCQRGA